MAAAGGHTRLHVPVIDRPPRRSLRLSHRTLADAVPPSIARLGDTVPPLRFVHSDPCEIAVSNIVTPS